MPHWIYSDLLNAMTRNMTIAVVNGPLTGERVAQIADALAVDQVGLFAHSSTSRGVLESPRLRAAVLCDPVVLPDVTFPMTLTSPSVDPVGPILVLRAERSYDDEGDDAPPIPPYIGPSLPEEVTTTVTLPRMAHADLLDDVWAEFGAQSIRGSWDRRADALLLGVDVSARRGGRRDRAPRVPARRRGARRGTPFSATGGGERPRRHAAAARRRRLLR